MTLHDVTHRTTLTLDDDVASRIEAEVRRSGRAHRTVVNEALRRGLEADRALPPFHLEARQLRLRVGVDLDDISGLLDRLDGPVAR